MSEIVEIRDAGGVREEVLRDMRAIQLRASSISDLFDCPARWYAKNIEKKYMPTSGNGHLGTSIHEGLAVFDRAVINGEVGDIDAAIATMVDNLHNPDKEVVWGDDSAQKVEPIGAALIKEYCTKIAPTQNYIAVEVTCPDLVIGVEEILIKITGTTDRLRRTARGIGISDLKTGKMAVTAQGEVEIDAHAAQLGAYEIIASGATGEPITEDAQIVGMQTNSKARVATVTTSRPSDLLLGDTDNPGYIDYAAKMFRSGMFYGNTKSMMCHEKYCPVYKECWFRSKK